MRAAAPGVAVPSRPAPALRPVAIWLLACAAMVAVMVAIGGITRLTESGLSITEWRPVTGALPPLSAAAWEAEFERYRRIPEYSAKNLGMTLAEFRAIYWWEWLHRFWGRLIGLAFALPFGWFLLRGRVGGALAAKLAGVLALGAVQGAVGWWMVASGLVDRVDVSQYRLALHLGLALAIYAALLWLALDLLRPRPADAPRGLARGANLVLALVALAILAGVFVAGTDAGRVYNTFPLMDGRVVPAGYLDLAPWWENAFENPAAVQFNHRVAAIVAWLGCLGFALAARTRLALALAAAATLQAGLGIAALLAAVPLALGLAHQAGALLVLTLALAMRHALGR